MTVAANDVIRVTAVMTGPNGEIANVYEFRANLVLAGNDNDVMDDMAAKMEEVYTPLKSYMGPDVGFSEIRGYNVTQGYPMPIKTWPTFTNGTYSGNSGAAAIALLGLLRTGIKRVVGRKFFGGIGRNVIDTGGSVISGATAAVATALGSLVGSFIAAGTLNTYLPGVLSKSGIFWGFIEGIASSNPVVQRRRRYGRGS